LDRTGRRQPRRRGRVACLCIPQQAVRGGGRAQSDEPTLALRAAQAARSPESQAPQTHALRSRLMTCRIADRLPCVRRGVLCGHNHQDRRGRRPRRLRARASTVLGLRPAVEYAAKAGNAARRRRNAPAQGRAREGCATLLTRDDFRASLDSTRVSLLSSQARGLSAIRILDTRARARAPQGSEWEDPARFESQRLRVTSDWVRTRISGS
jgi:hypothetical protein